MALSLTYSHICKYTLTGKSLLASYHSMGRPFKKRKNVRRTQYTRRKIIGAIDRCILYWTLVLQHNNGSYR